MLEKSTVETSSKRDAILQAARKLFAHTHYEETTIADIAREAGIAVGTVYLYFPNKHAIYTAVALNLDLMIADAFSSPHLLEIPFSEALESMINTIFLCARNEMQLASFLQADMTSPTEVEMHREFNRQLCQRLAQVFDHAIQKGELAPFDTTAYAEMLNLTGKAILHQCFAVENGKREDFYRTCYTEFMQRLFFGPSLREGSK